jgi:polyisoprenoid-binding protein YceI
MKLFPRICALAWLGLFPALAAAAPVNYQIDAAHSSVQFAVTHLGLARIVGRFHQLQGSFGYDAAHIENSSARITVQAGSIDTGHDERDQHLRSDEFFDATRFPAIRFESKSVSGNGSGFVLSGDLTLLGVIRPVTFQVNKIGEGRDPWGGRRAGFEATTTLKRSDFGMRYMLGPVGDAVTVTVDIEGIREP